MRVLALCVIVFVPFAALADSDSERIGRWTLLRGVEKALQGTAGVVRGMGDALAVGTGGTLRGIGGIVRKAGQQTEDLGDVVAGDQTEEDEQAASSALRSVASRPIRVVGRALRAVGDTTNFLGDTTERLTSEAVGILPDTVRIFESGVRSLRIQFDGEEPGLDAELTAADAFHTREYTPALGDQPATVTALKLRRLKQGLEEGAPHGQRHAKSDPEQHASSDGHSAASAAHAPMAAPAPSPTTHASPPMRLLARLGLWRPDDDAASPSGVRAHVLVCLASVALGARASRSLAGVLALVLLSLLHLSSLLHAVDERQTESTRRAVAYAERAARTLSHELPLLPEACHWLNALLASGWEATIQPYLEASVSREVRATLSDLELPKTLKSIELAELRLGRRPPAIRTLAAVAAPGPTRVPSRGVVLQAELEWEANDASATLNFRLANVATQPRLRIRRARLRATLRMHWEWVQGEPFVGAVRVAFVKPPDVASFALEPLGTLDVTTLPGLGAWLRDAFNTKLLQSMCLPNWLATDMRLPSAASDASAAEDTDTDVARRAASDGGSSSSARSAMQGASSTEAHHTT